ncbi:MAG: hypothetical protein NUV67_00435 [archaeon]|nr:hypothetical protein [archaeon]
MRAFLRKVKRNLGLERGSIGFGKRGIETRWLYGMRPARYTGQALERPRDARLYWKINAANFMNATIDHGNYQSFRHMREDIFALMHKSIKVAQEKGAQGIEFMDVELGPMHVQKEFPQITLEGELRKMQTPQNIIAGLGHTDELVHYESVTPHRPAYRYKLLSRHF